MPVDTGRTRSRPNHANGQLANIAVVGIGSMSPNATFTQFGYVTPQELEILKKQGGVGDILGQFYDKDGNRLDVDFTIDS